MKNLKKMKARMVESSSFCYIPSVFKVWPLHSHILHRQIMRVVLWNHSTKIASKPPSLTKLICKLISALGEFFNTEMDKLYILIYCGVVWLRFLDRTVEKEREKNKMRIIFFFSSFHTKCTYKPCVIWNSLWFINEC